MECTLSALKNLLQNPHITDICINGTRSVYIEDAEGLHPWDGYGSQSITEKALKDWILEELSKIGKVWDAKYPFVDGTLLSGHRVHVAFPPLAQPGILISLRRLNHARCATAGTSRWIDSPAYGPLVLAVQRGDSILISGATGSGKTTLANDLLAEVPAHERIIALEDTPELSPRHPHFLSLLTRLPNPDGFGEVNLRTLLRQTLRMRPDRIVLGECRGVEVLDLLQALNTGHRGALATLHANSPRDALRRVELLCHLNAPHVLAGMKELLSIGIQWVVQVKRIGNQRKIVELSRIEGREGDVILMRSVSS